MEKIKKQVYSLIYLITKEIEERNIDVLELCDKLVLSSEQFIDLMNNPQDNLSLYIEILEEVRNERD